MFSDVADFFVYGFAPDVFVGLAKNGPLATCAIAQKGFRLTQIRSNH